MCDAAVFDDFVEGFVDLTRKYVVGNPLDAGDHARADGARRASPTRCARQIAEARRKGAKALIDMKVPNDSAGSPYLAPQVLTNVDHQMEVMREESFGPVVGIMKVRDDEEAIQLMNDSPYGLTASIWTHDIDRAAEIGARVETGTVFMNRCDYLDPASPGPASRTPAAAPRCPNRLRRADAAEKLSPARRLTSPSISEQDMSVTTANWNYPTAVRFGAGRITELADACRGAGHQAPAARHRCRARQAADHRARHRAS